MRIAHVNTSDVAGGAARAAHRLHRGLLAEGVESAMFVRDRLSSDPAVRSLATIATTLRAYANAAIVLPYRRRTDVFNASPLPERVLRTVRRWDPDVVNLHWIADGFVAPRGLRGAGRPLVWTLHDSHAFTGGCHVPLDCRRYTGRCGACPVLGSSTERDLSRWVWRRKQRAWRGLDLTIVTPSRWMAACARASSLFRDRRIEVIPNGLDVQAFRPIARVVAREVLRLPADRKYVLFTAVGGASYPVKGFVHLAAALRALAARGAARGLELLLGGSDVAPGLDCGVPVRCMGMLHDDVSIALLNCAADVVAVPSVQDNFPNTILEAFACGRPAAAFRIGGSPDIITDRADGVLVEPFDTNDLARGLEWILEDEGRWRELSASARRTAESRYTLEIQARRYLALYQELTDPARLRRPVPSPA